MIRSLDTYSVQAVGIALPSIICIFTSMKWLSFVLVISLSACVEVTFNQPQPENTKPLKSFPMGLRGKYIIPEDTTDNRKPDTLIIDKDYYLISGQAQPDQWLNRGALSDSLILKKYKGYYFLNFYMEKQWMLRVLKQEKSGDLTFYNISLTDESSLEKLKATFHPEVIKENSNTFYKIHPSPSPEVLLKFVQENYNDRLHMQKLKR